MFTSVQRPKYFCQIICEACRVIRFELLSIMDLNSPIWVWGLAFLLLLLCHSWKFESYIWDVSYILWKSRSSRYIRHQVERSLSSLILFLAREVMGWTLGQLIKKILWLWVMIPLKIKIYSQQVTAYSLGMPYLLQKLKQPQASSKELGISIFLCVH